MSDDVNSIGKWECTFNYRHWRVWEWRAPWLWPQCFVYQHWRILCLPLPCRIYRRRENMYRLVKRILYNFTDYCKEIIHKYSADFWFTSLPSYLTPTLPSCNTDYPYYPYSIFCLITDIDECVTPEKNECHLNALCNNTEGSYVCRCLNGYQGDGRSCTGEYLFYVFICNKRGS